MGGARPGTESVQCPAGLMMPDTDATVPEEAAGEGLAPWSRTEASLAVVVVPGRDASLVAVGCDHEDRDRPPGRALQAVDAKVVARQ
jgi:hypothetical protein